VSKRANSSSAYSEQWGVDLARESDEARQRVEQSIQYADLCDLMVMLDLKVEGGVMEAFRLGQDLIEVPGQRSSQASFE
jgi:hypothetical protein